MRSHDSGVVRLAPHRYLFRSTWQLPASAERTFTLLADVQRYPHWWPEFRSATMTAADRGDFAVRSVLPFTLRFTLQRAIEDHTTRQLRARASGDIDGTVEWAVHGISDCSARAEFTQDVHLRHRAAVRFDRVIRGLLEWNHQTAMASGARGLAQYVHTTDGDAPKG